MSRKNPFPYPGGKALTAPRIIEKFPEHKCYVEVFGGAASVLCQKDPQTSLVEVYNDFNGEVVNYFEVALERPNELRERLDKIPYSRSFHADVKGRWYGGGSRPDDPVNRAAEFVFLHCANQNSIFRGSGFVSSRKRNHARRFRKVTDRVEWVSERFRDVVIENDDWGRVVDRYDGSETLFYFDPPYLHIDDDGMYATDPVEFDHGSFVDRIQELDAQWIVSYSEVPDGLDREEYVVEQWDKSWKSGKTTDDQSNVYGKESLIMNYDPESEPLASVGTDDPSEW